MSRVKIGPKWSVRPERILTEQETVRVLARLSDPNLLVIETAINWRGDIDDPKSRTSKRPLTLGYLVDRYRAKAAADKVQLENWVFVRADGSGLQYGIPACVKHWSARPPQKAATSPGLGPHSFRRANITWRQEVGASSIEASKIAGHSTVRMTEEYTKIQLPRQEETTRRIQERLASVGEKQPAVVRVVQ
jgi:integrase